ncbi:MAG: peroxiredoxin [Candidatus Korarchaeum sp.]
MIGVGSFAPDFTLPDQFGEEVTLYELRGKRILLSFHPLAWTSVCEEQVKELESLYPELEELGVVPLSVSVDPVPSKRAWARHMGVVKTALLSDFWPHGQVSRAYGLFDEKRGVSGRAVILIDEEGIVVYAKEYPLNEKPNMEDVMKFLRARS